MSEETGQADDDRDELTAQLAEVRGKYEASQAHGRWQGRMIGDMKQKASKMIAELEEAEAECNAAKADLRLQLLAKSVIIAERDAAERERTESRAEVVRLRVERDAALAHPPENAARIAELAEAVAERDALRHHRDDLQVQLSQCQAECDAIREQLARSKEAADNAAFQGAIRELRAEQMHTDLPGLLAAIQGAAEQARGLI